MTQTSEIVYINGRFLTQRMSGVQRFARELVMALDAELSKTHAGRQWVLLAPKMAADDLPLHTIELRRVGAGDGHLWDQLVFPVFARSGLAVSLANNGAVLHRRSLTILHDAMVFRTPNNFSPAYRLFHRALDRMLAKRSQIGTVSEFSRRELAEVLGLDQGRIFLIPNGCEHLGRVEADPNALLRLGVQPRQYFLFVGSPSPNKNLTRAIQAFASLPDDRRLLVIVGASKATVFAEGLGDIPARVILAGYLSDAELSTLYREAIALIFPSIYEGFGIPPLEAMFHGCPVLAADIPAVREVCGDSAIYFNPLDVASIAQAFSRASDSAPPLSSIKRDIMMRCARYSWSASARTLIAAVDALAHSAKRWEQGSSFSGL
ncbi:conserved protein of unknown function [Methylocella tundrae]|uniref:Glycosyl transferase family 1 domain-containing protein n=2 Tax=Methylocella tundrae TaxID=227605 RepID=A0A4U8Z222_METTU|nr:glycosyltransferase family 1 protein [Methylocella tundrae]VFU09318.1 conserved protein of unknown function [Methylocella tundrae]